MKKQVFYFAGPIIVGAGPSGLAVAACFKSRGIECLILERAHCVASLWRLKTYDRLRLHLPKSFCELPLMSFPAALPLYPTKRQFVAYLDAYASEFGLRPRFGVAVISAEREDSVGLWRLLSDSCEEFTTRWLVVATGENAEPEVPAIPGAADFRGPVLHTSAYRSGEAYRGKRVLVIGCGNSGMEVALDLCEHNAIPSIVVRDTVRILPRQMLGRSTFVLSMWLLKWLTVRSVDRFLLTVARLMLGDTARLGLHRPQLGPLELKSLTGKTSVLDVGSFAKIKSGSIKVRPAIKRITDQGAEFVDGRIEDFDATIFATGYKSNVLRWLKESDMFLEMDGLPRKPFPNGWKGQNGLYAVGFTKRGLVGASLDAMRIAQDVELSYKVENVNR